MAQRIVHNLFERVQNLRHSRAQRHSRAGVNPTCTLQSQRATRWRGSTLSAVLIALSIIGTFAMTAAIIGPRYIQASTTVDVVEASDPRNQAIIEAIGAILQGSCEIIAIHPRGASPFVEIVLRLGCESSEIVGHEVVVISHSRILQTITLYAREQDDDTVLERATMLNPGFCDRWRSEPDVIPRILATGITELTVERLAHHNQERTFLRIALTWGSNSADAHDEASMLVDAPLRHAAESTQPTT